MAAMLRAPLRALARTAAYDRRIPSFCTRGPRLAGRFLTVRFPPFNTLPEERRYADDGIKYTKSEFIEYFGSSFGQRQWERADPSKHVVSHQQRRDQRSSPTAKPRVGDFVAVVEKKNYGTSIRIEGVVSRVLTKSAAHRHGFKVMLTTGVVGRCTEIKSQ